MDEVERHVEDCAQCEGAQLHETLLHEGDIRGGRTEDVRVRRFERVRAARAEVGRQLVMPARK